VTFEILIGMLLGAWMQTAEISLLASYVISSVLLMYIWLCLWY